MGFIKSMTAFASLEKHEDYGDLNIVIRTVNSRFLDLSFSLSEEIKTIEPLLNKILKAKLKRGKVECTITFIPAYQKELQVNEVLLNQLILLNQKIVIKLPQANTSTMHLLTYPGVLISKRNNQSEDIEHFITSSFEQVVQTLDQNRIKEGKQLTEVLSQKLDQIESLLVIIKDNLEQLTSKERARILKKIEQLKIELDAERIEQEVAISAQKSDIAEEYDRLYSHVKTVRNILQNGDESCGKRLDFMMQEFNRESNTIASKVNNIELTKIAVDLKVLIEQMREQVQNIE